MILKYDIINPKTNKKKPYYDDKTNLLIIPTIKKYNYFIEVYSIDNYGIIHFYLLFGKELFDENCRKCNKDRYNRLLIKVRGDFKEYIKQSMKEKGNININYVESEDEYDVWEVL